MMHRIIVFAICLLAQGVGFGAIRGINLVPSGQNASGGCATPADPSSCVVSSNSLHWLIGWTDNSTEDGFDIWRSVDGASIAAYTNAAANSTSLQDGQALVGDGHVYIYKVRATNACGTQSAFSNTVTNDIFVDATHYWKFEEAAGNARVDSIGSVTFTESGGAVVRTNGVHGNASYFSDNGRDLTNRTGVSMARDITISAWFRMNVQPDAGSDYFFLLSQDSGGINMATIASDNGNGIIMGGEEGTFADGNGPFSLNVWHLIVGTWLSSDNMFVSVDGAAFSGDAIVGWPSDTALLLRLGSNGGSLGGVTIDEACIWPRALSQAEVTSLYGGGTAPRFK